MSIWKLTYFELNYTSAYKSEIYYGIDARNAALALFFRLGGDDVVQVTALNLDTLVSWLTHRLPRIVKADPHRFSQ
jgi:hypothetical protein